MMRGAREGRAGYHEEAFGSGHRGIGDELLGRGVAGDGSVFEGWLQILADGQEIDIGGAEVVHDLGDFVRCFTQARHDAGFGEKIGGEGFGFSEQGERNFVSCMVLQGLR